MISHVPKFQSFRDILSNGDELLLNFRYRIGNTPFRHNFARNLKRQEEATLYLIKLDMLKKLFYLEYNRKINIMKLNVWKVIISIIQILNKQILADDSDISDMVIPIVPIYHAPDK